MSIAKFARNLKLSEQQIWISTKNNTVSYPVDGHSLCFQLEDNSFWFEHRNDCIITAIKQFPPSGGILDIGGGNGYIARRILDEDFECTLLEPGFTGALNAKREREIPEVICSSLEAANFEHGKLAAVGMFDVIEHIKDDRRMVNEIYNLLQPKGLFYCTVPAYRWLWSQHDVTAGHIRRYDLSGIEELFTERFELLYSSYFFPFW